MEQDKNAPKQAIVNTLFGSVFGSVEQHVTSSSESTCNEGSRSTQAPEAPATPLSNRQLVILFTTVLDLTLAPEYTNQKALSRLLAAVSGRSAEGLRKTINECSRQGDMTPQLCADYKTVASLLDDIKPDLAEKLRNSAEE